MNREAAEDVAQGLQLPRRGVSTIWPMRPPGACNVYLCAMSVVGAPVRSAEKFQNDRQWREYLLFYEYFRGDDDAGTGGLPPKPDGPER